MSDEKDLEAAKPIDVSAVAALNDRIALLEKTLAGLAGRFGKDVHANSGPTGHANEPGHANFTKVGLDAATRINVADLGARGAHANSGPTGHVNEPGHANFDQISRPGLSKVLPVNIQRLGKLGGLASGAHANSGPTSHSNVPGHANFAKQFDDIRDIEVTLPDGTRLTLDARSPASITVNGFRVTRG